MVLDITLLYFFVLTVSLSASGAELKPFENIENLIKIAIAIFSLLLLSLSISAYVKTHLKKVLYASLAFALFAIQLFLEYLEDTVKSFETPYNDIIFYSITLAILALFFLAVVRRR